ncbi:MAG: bifunctional lysylphosphatidylglycerol flippase/synthetase MprF [Verrucomicrobiales bacterium]
MSEGRFKIWLHRLLPIAIIVVFCAALWALHRELTQFKFADFRAFVSELSAQQIAFAIAATLAGYCALIAYDLFGLRYVGTKLAAWRIALTAFVGYAFSMNIGHSTLSGGAVRMRLYTGWGVEAADVARIVGFNFVIGTTGQLLAAGLLFLFAPIAVPASVPLPWGSLRPLGIVLLVVVGLFFLLMFRRKAPLRFRDWQLPLPPFRLALPAVITSAVDWGLSGVVLFTLLPDSVEIGFFQLLCTVMLAHFVALLSMVPGGLGVFETVVIHLLPESASKPDVLSALLAFRAVYYLTPFLIAVTLLGAYETGLKRHRLSSLAGRVNAWISPLVPHILSVATFAAGAILLLSGATPGIRERMLLLGDWIPLPVIELSHLLGSIVGVSLLLLAGALRRRIDAAFVAVVTLLVVGIAASLFKGLDYEEAVILSLVLFAIAPCRKRFHRKASLFSMRFTGGWWLSIALVVGAITWIGFIAYERVHYHEGLWTHFGFHGDASRFLRASAGIAVVLSAFAIWQLLRPGSRTPPALGGPEELANARSIIEASGDTTACLAFLGDKRFLFSESGRSFLMFGIRKRTWISMGDPVGDPSESEDLIWNFREQCDAAGARPAFYEVKASTAHIYAGLGMTLYKLGEEARINLRQFSLEGSARSRLRQTVKKMERENTVSFEIVPAERYHELRDEYRAISDDWLGSKGAGEKSFSLGSFRDDYLRHFDFACIRTNGKLVAFANVWRGAGMGEVSIDLMRHAPDAPNGVMEYLFIQLMLWGKSEGYDWFSLGMSPLAGLENHALAPLWHRIGAQVFSHGEHFYNFKGLRAYKEKFSPEWEPRYLACPGTASLPAVLLDATALIGGGLKSAIRKSR